MKTCKNVGCPACGAYYTIGTFHKQVGMFSNYRRTQILLLLLGLLILVCAISALAYAYWPLGALEEHAPLAPTLFAPP
jgi:hypothetical protein